MKKLISLTIFSVILTSCSMNGMKPPPDASGGWTSCDPDLPNKLGTNGYFNKKTKI